MAQRDHWHWVAPDGARGGPFSRAAEASADAVRAFFTTDLVALKVRPDKVRAVWRALYHNGWRLETRKP